MARLKLLNCPIIIGNEALRYLHSTFDSKSELVILSDENSVKYCLPLLLKEIPSLKNKHIIIIESGEEQKNLETSSAIWEYLTNINFSKKGIILGLGGGVISDLSGFIAGIYKRGIKYYLVPTTLLAQTDASIGFKTGVDFMNYKNQLGLIYKPEAVIVNAAFLRTLEKREFISGLAEIIKHGLIANKNILQKITKGINFKLQTISEELLVDSIKTKINIVSKDPEEKGLRRVLNFGHTIGHAMESFLLAKPKRKILHGEAVALGMICEAYIAKNKKLISKKEFEFVLTLLAKYFSKVKFKKSEIPSIVLLIKQDKKNDTTSTNFSLINGIGKCQFNIPVDFKEVVNALDFYYEL